MLTKNIQPSTIGGIKRRAKQLKKEHNISHHEALNIAAQNASFENYTHARKQLHNSGFQLFFAVYWYDRQNHKTGTEVLEVKLSKPLLEIATKNELKKPKDIKSFRLASPDLLVNDHISRSQNDAREKICHAARILRFIEATGLKPGKDHMAAYPNRDENNKLPGTDHSTNWYDPATDQFILIDEPYLDRIVNDERTGWAKKHNWHLQATKWAGMYFPNNTSMFVATDAAQEYDFKGLLAIIDSIPHSITAENWTGTSSEGHGTFFSPLTVTLQDKNRAVAKGTICRVASDKTQPMKYWDAPHNERRPNAVMSIESHQLAARLIKAIQQPTAGPAATFSQLTSIKSKLEDWFHSEYRSAVTNKFDDFYYSSIDINDPLVLRANTSKGVASLLQELKELLLDNYVDCQPLKAMTKRLDTLIKLTSKLL